jgi:beta-lactamase superfamily II metal-dependent hydrolase
MDLNLPELDCAEITLLGTGGGYGESIVLHIGNNNWVVIDSCIDPNNKKCIPLEYLESIGVNVSQQVKMILCTHWHDDHILGISELLEKCKSSKFSMARPNDITKFLRMVKLDYQKSNAKVSNSSTVEFNKCLEILEVRGAPLKHAQADTTIFTAVVNNFRNEVIALSPSDYTLKEFDYEISALITDFGISSKQIISKSPNAKSVALFLKLGEHRAILGSDLEVSANDYEGWINILDQNQVIDKSASLFKIPHHGSDTGYHKRIWDELLLPQPVSKLTPWNKSFKLPRPEMLKKYLDHTENLYMTSPLINPSPKKRNRKIEKDIKNSNVKISEVKFEFGIVRSRINMFNINEFWQTELHNKALQVIK